MPFEYLHRARTKHRGFQRGKLVIILIFIAFKIDRFPVTGRCNNGPNANVSILPSSCKVSAILGEYY